MQWQPSPPRSSSDGSGGVLEAVPPEHQTSDDQPSSARVLVIEDDPRSARVAMAHLEGAGYRVSLAHTAADAQRQVERDLPDVVLCDVCLPDMDGIQLTSWIRRRFTNVN